jgi:uncharacterized protein (TIGR02246 family)
MITRDARHEVEASPLRNLVQQVVDAWERGDGRALAAAFADDADVIFFDGSHAHGGPQIAAVMQHLFDTALKGTRCLAHGQGAPVCGSRGCVDADAGRRGLSRGDRSSGRAMFHPDICRREDTRHMEGCLLPEHTDAGREPRGPATAPMSSG